MGWYTLIHYDSSHSVNPIETPSQPYSEVCWLGQSRAYQVDDHC